MGTRNLTLVCLEGKYPVAQYGQFDGYPAGQGETILQFCRSADNLLRLAQALPRCRWITETEADAVNAELRAKNSSLAKLHPALSRETAGGILELVAGSAEGDIVLQDNLDFAADSLMCEWAYVVDLDSGVLEVHKGFNKQALTEEDRFYFLRDSVDRDRRVGVYEPIKLVASYPLDALPTDFSELEKELSGEEEEESEQEDC